MKMSDYVLKINERELESAWKKAEQEYFKQMKGK